MPRGTATPRARWIAGAGAAIAYAGLSYLFMTRARNSTWTLALVLGPLVLLGAASAWGKGHRALAAGGTLAAAALAAYASTGRSLSASWLYLGQHAGVHLALAAWFGSTLRRGADPLVTALARRVHGSLTDAMLRYTRQVTLAWTLYFAAMVAASLTLFLAGDFAHWSLLADILTPAFTAAFFAAEYLLRYRLHPEFERVGFHQAIVAWRSHRAGDAHARPSIL